MLEGGALVPGREDAHDRAAYVAALGEIREAGGDVLVAIVDEEVVGMVQVLVFRHVQHRGGLCAELESLHVRADRRGHGIGGRLLEVAVDRAREAGCYRVQLTSNTARAEAHRFYERAGFVPTHVGFKLLLE